VTDLSQNLFSPRVYEEFSKSPSQSVTRHFSVGKIMTKRQRIAEQFAAPELLATTIIAGSPALCPEGELMQQWADLIVTQAEQQPDAGPIFAALAHRRAASRRGDS